MCIWQWMSRSKDNGTGVHVWNTPPEGTKPRLSLSPSSIWYVPTVTVVVFTTLSHLTPTKDRRLTLRGLFPILGFQVVLTVWSPSEELWPTGLDVYRGRRVKMFENPVTTFQQGKSYFLRPLSNGVPMGLIFSSSICKDVYNYGMIFRRVCEE